MNLLEQCVCDLDLVALEISGELDRRVDNLVNTYLVGFGSQTGAMRKELEKAFVHKSPMTPIRDRIRARIMREDA